MLISVMRYVSDYRRVHVAHTCIGCGHYNVNTASTSWQMSVCLSFMITVSHRAFSGHCSTWVDLVEFCTLIRINGVAVSTKSWSSYGCLVITTTVKVTCRSLAHHYKVPALFSLSWIFIQMLFSIAELELDTIYAEVTKSRPLQPKVDHWMTSILLKLITHCGRANTWNTYIHVPANNMEFNYTRTSLTRVSLYFSLHAEVFDPARS